MLIICPVESINGNIKRVNVATAKTFNRAVRHVNRCMELASGSQVVADDFYNRQCRELVRDKMNQAGIPYEAPKEEVEAPAE